MNTARANVKCWWRHDWKFLGGYWVIPKTFAITKRECYRCKLYQEIGQDHVFGLNTLELELKEQPA